MNLAAALFYPVILLLPAAGIEDSVPSESTNKVADPRSLSWGGQAYLPSDEAWLDAQTGGEGLSISPLWVTNLRNVEPASASQVRIEQRMTIRITPRGSRRAAPNMLVGMPDSDPEMEFVERKIGKCIPVSMIGGVQPKSDNRLLLFMRDHRVISAELERSCRAGAFYSGFLLSRSTDGQLCVDRDTLQSRSGSKCKLTRIRQLVEEDD